MHYEFEGQAYQWVILLSRGSTKRGCLHWVLKDGRNVDTQMEWGGGGISGRGLAEAKARRRQRAPSAGGEPPRVQGQGRSRKYAGESARVP